MSVTSEDFVGTEQVPHPDDAFTGVVHPYADRWPMRPADEIEDMAASITANGQRFPIILAADGTLVDGRNRLRACELAGVKPWFQVYDELYDDDAITSFIWDANGDRRNLSKGQRAMLAALRPGGVRPLSGQTGVATGYIDKARQVIQWCDNDVVEAVIAGGPIPNSISQNPRVMGRGYEMLLERVAADAFNYGFTASGSTALGFDSVGLFSNSHAIGQNTVDNLGTLTFTETNVGTAIEQLDSLQDAKGNIAGFRADTLMVPTAYEAAAWVMANPATAAPTSSFVAHRIRNVIVNPWLTDTNAWFVLDGAAAKEHLLFRVFGGDSLDEPGVESYIDHSVRSVVWQMGRTFDFNWDDPRFAVGQNPS